MIWSIVFSSFVASVVGLLLATITFILWRWNKLLKDDVSRFWGMKYIPIIAKHEVNWEGIARQFPKVIVIITFAATCLYIFFVGLVEVLTV